MALKNALSSKEDPLSAKALFSPKAGFEIQKSLFNSAILF
jgi:hypothetical protein